MITQPDELEQPSDWMAAGGYCDFKCQVDHKCPATVQELITRKKQASYRAGALDELMRVQLEVLEPCTDEQYQWLQQRRTELSRLLSKQWDDNAKTN
jgi:hypothetical protein